MRHEQNYMLENLIMMIFAPFIIIGIIIGSPVLGLWYAREAFRRLWESQARRRLEL